MEKQLLNVPDALKKIRSLEKDLLDLIPKCNESQLNEVDDIINTLLIEKERLVSIQDEFIEKILDSIN